MTISSALLFNPLGNEKVLENATIFKMAGQNTSDPWSGG
jgi:hypothetical protein